MWAQLRVEINSNSGLVHLPRVQERLGFGHIKGDGAKVVFSSWRDMRLLWHYLIEPFATTYFQKFCYFYFCVMRGSASRMFDGFQSGAHDWTLDSQLRRDSIWPISL